MPRRGPVVPKLDLSRLGKFQVGNEKEEKSKSEYSYKEVRPTVLPHLCHRNQPCAWLSEIILCRDGTNTGYLYECVSRFG